MTWIGSPKSEALVAVPAPHFQAISCFEGSAGRLTLSLDSPAANDWRHPAIGAAGHVGGGSEVDVEVDPIVLEVDVDVVPMMVEVVVVVPPPPAGVVTASVSMLGLRTVGTPDPGEVSN